MNYAKRFEINCGYQGCGCIGINNNKKKRKIWNKTNINNCIKVKDS